MKRPQTTWWLRQGDKLFLVAVLIICAVAVVSFWGRAARHEGAPSIRGGSSGVVRGGFDNWPSFETRLPDVSVDLATDADEYLPGPGEHVCVNPDCPYIVPDGHKRCPKCKAVQDDRDHDGMDDAFEQRHKATDPDVADGDVDYDGDKFTNLEEYLGGSDPDDANSIPAPIKLVGVGQEFVDVLFRGFAKRQGKITAIQLNWGNDVHTDILMPGSSFRGYKLERIITRPVTRGSEEQGTQYVEEDYDLVLRRPGGGTLVLPRNTAVREPERYGVFVSTKTAGPRVRAYPGTRFEIENHTYPVVAVGADSARLIGDRSEEYNLELRPE
jgi:hypothetical protein